MRHGARHPGNGPTGTAFLARVAAAVLLAFAGPGPAAAAPTELGICLNARSTLQAYADEFIRHGWRHVTEQDPEHDRASRRTAEIVGTLRSFPVAFTEPQQVRTHVNRIVALGRQATLSPQSILLARDEQSLMILRDTRAEETRLTCYLGAKMLPDVAYRLRAPGRNPSGAPLAWNLISSGPLETPHVFAEIMYVRLFFHPAQHLLAGGDGIVTHLTFRQTAEKT